jgi:hypothetical protein
MRYRTEKEVEEFFKDLYADEYDSDREITVNSQGDRHVISIKQMYNYVPLNFARLLKVSEFFDTKNINDSRYHRGGCETCDYGSSYEITLTVEED